MNLILERIQNEARKRPKHSFVREYPGIYLMGEMRLDTNAEAWIFKTEIRKPQHLAPSLPGPGSSMHFFLIKVAKKDGLWGAYISVGRAGNNDVTLRHPSVSKLHAQIFTEQKGKESSYSIVDVGSVNGTWVNETRVEPRTPTPISSKDRLAFGQVDCQFLSVDDLYERLLSFTGISRHEFD